MRLLRAFPFLVVAGFAANSLVGLSGCSSDSSADDGSADGSSRNDTGSNNGNGNPNDPDGNTKVIEEGELVLYGDKYEGGEFHLGPVDYEETEWHNACAPAEKYATSIREAQGELLVGLWGGIPNVGGYCDACIRVTTGMGKEATLRVVTYGDTTPNSIDVSPAAYALLNSDEYPRSMSWQFAKCPDTGKVVYQFQTESHEDWTSLWVRNARVPLRKVEVRSVKHPTPVELQRGGDGTLTDNAGFGRGEFTIILTGIDGQTYEDTFPWPADGVRGQLLTGQGNFR